MLTVLNFVVEMSKQRLPTFVVFSLTSFPPVFFLYRRNNGTNFDLNPAAYPPIALFSNIFFFFSTNKE